MPAPQVIIRKINTKNFTDENIKKYQIEVERQLAASQIEAFRGHLTRESDQNRQDGTNFIDSEISRTLRETSFEVFGSIEQKIGRELIEISIHVEY